MSTDISEQKLWCQLVFIYFNLYNEASRKYKIVIIQFFISVVCFLFTIHTPGTFSICNLKVGHCHKQRIFPIHFECPAATVCNMWSDSKLNTHCAYCVYVYCAATCTAVVLFIMHVLPHRTSVCHTLTVLPPQKFMQPPFSYTHSRKWRKWKLFWSSDHVSWKSISWINLRPTSVDI
jgi:hypothetical protein